MLTKFRFACAPLAIALGLVLGACAPELASNELDDETAAQRSDVDAENAQVLIYIEMENSSDSLSTLKSAESLVCEEIKQGKRTRIEKCVSSTSNKFFAFLYLEKAVVIQYGDTSCHVMGMPQSVASLPMASRGRAASRPSQPLFVRDNPIVVTNVFTTIVYLHERNVEDQVAHDILRAFKARARTRDVFSQGSPHDELTAQTVRTRLAQVKSYFLANGPTAKPAAARVTAAEQIVQRELATTTGAGTPLRGYL